jgi:recombination protein RecT
MANQKNEIAKKTNFSTGLREVLEQNKLALPEDFNTTRFVNNAVALLNENEKLRDFAKEYGTAQIQQGMLKAAYLGLDFMNKEAYLVPYKNELTFVLDYRGQEKLCKKYSQRPIKEIYAKLVRQGDDFEEVITDGHQSINFKPLPFNGGEILGAFAVCQFVDGGMIYDTMSLEELENTRSHSKAKDSMAWKDFTGEMYRKTVLHRLCKHINLDFDNLQQKDAFYEDSLIETDPKEKAHDDVENEVATEEFYVEAEAKEVE